MAQWVMGHLVTIKHYTTCDQGTWGTASHQSSLLVPSGLGEKAGPVQEGMSCEVFNLKLPSLKNTDLEQRQVFKEFQNNCRYDPYGSLERCLLGSILEKVCYFGPTRWYCLIEGTLSTVSHSVQSYLVGRNC